MRILLVRHGRSEGNVDENAYAEKGDQNVELVDEGWRQTIGTGIFLRSVYSGQEEWPITYVSPYKRTKQSLSGILHGMDGIIPGQPMLRADARLIEKSFGATNILNYPPDSVDSEFVRQFKEVVDRAYEVDPFTTHNPLGDSSKDNLVTIKGFIDGTFSHQVDIGGDDFLFVIHGAVIKDFILSWAHLQMQSRSDIPSPGNGDVIAIEGETGNWTIRKIYDGETGQKVDIDILEGLNPLCVNDLPPVPDHIRRQFIDLGHQEPN